MGWPPPQAVGETEAFITKALADQAGETPPCVHFCIALVAKEEPIGVTSLFAIDREHHHATVGSWIGQPHWGRGLMRESKALLFKVAFEMLGLERLQAWVDVDNHRSISSLENCGFRREGLARRHAFHQGRHVNQMLMAILRGEETDLVNEMLGGNGAA